MRRNALEPLAYDTETRRFTLSRRSIKREEQIGVHTTPRIELSALYAVQRAALTNNSIAILFEIDVRGLTAEPDVDAIYSAETTPARDILDEEVLGVEDVETARDAIQSQLDWGSDGDSGYPPETWVDCAQQAISGTHATGILSGLLDLDDDTLSSVLREARETNSFPLWLWANAVEQHRFLEPIGLDRITRVIALRPIRMALWHHDADDPSWEEQEYPEDDPDAPQIFVDEDIYNQQYMPDMVELYENKRPGATVEYHGTDLTRAKMIAPELGLENPWGYYQEREG